MHHVCRNQYYTRIHMVVQYIIFNIPLETDILKIEWKCVINTVFWNILSFVSSKWMPKFRLKKSVKSNASLIFKIHQNKSKSQLTSKNVVLAQKSVFHSVISTVVKAQKSVHWFQNELTRWRHLMMFIRFHLNFTNNSNTFVIQIIESFHLFFFCRVDNFELCDCWFITTETFSIVWCIMNKYCSILL